MHGLVVIEGMTLSGHPWIINEMSTNCSDLDRVILFHRHCEELADCSPSTRSRINQLPGLFKDGRISIYVHL